MEVSKKPIHIFEVKFKDVFKSPYHARSRRPKTAKEINKTSEQLRKTKLNDTDVDTVIKTKRESNTLVLYERDGSDKDVDTVIKTKQRESNTWIYERDGSVVTAAIDLGTTCSGYAFCLKDSQDKIMTGTHGNMLPEDRIPTVLLLNPDKSFHSFGYEAMDNYAKLDDDQKSEYFYLEHFKMELYKTRDLSRNTKILDCKQKEVNALDVFAISIKYFKDMLLKIADSTTVGLKEEYIQWMITVPAIWTDSSRQFMREAAMQAGISRKKIRLILESEAASIFCQHQKNVATGEKIERFPVGHKYILADLGGGTADICVHEILAEDKIRELHRATGGDMGCSLINEEFCTFFRDLVGKDIWKAFKDTYLTVYFEMLKNFELKKRTFSTQGHTQTVNLVLENALMRLLEKKSGKPIEALIQNVESINYNEHTGWLVIEKELMEKFFSATVTGIVDKVKETVETCSDVGIKTLMLVGGYSDVPYLRERIQEEFKDKTVILHKETRLAVLKGALMMGYMPRNVVQRRAQFTYGFAYKVPFIVGKHPEKLKVTIDDEDWCGWIFDKIIEKGQVLDYGDTFICQGFEHAKGPETKQKELYSRLWRSNHKTPPYCTEDFCEKVGFITVKPPKEGWPDYWECEEQLLVGETEFTVKYINKTLEEEYEADMDFL